LADTVPTATSESYMSRASDSTQQSTTVHEINVFIVLHCTVIYGSTEIKPRFV